MGFHARNENNTLTRNYIMSCLDPWRRHTHRNRPPPPAPLQSRGGWQQLATPTCATCVQGTPETQGTTRTCHVCYFRTLFLLLIPAPPVDPTVPPRGHLGLYQRMFLRSRYGCTHCRDSEFDKRKSENAGPRRRHRLKCEWAPPARTFSNGNVNFH